MDAFDCFNPFATSNKLVHKYRGNISSRLSSNSEACASELLEILEEMFPPYLYSSVSLTNEYRNCHQNLSYLKV